MYICDSITEKLIMRHIIKESESNICKQGLQIIFSDVINILLVIITGILSKNLLYSFIYIMTFCVIRKFSGGFHASTFQACRIFMIATFIVTIVLARLTAKISIWVSVFCTIFTMITMILYSPIVHPNRKLTIYEIRANKFVSILLSCIYSIAVYWLIMMKSDVGLYLSLVLFAVSVFMYVGKFMSSRSRF